MTVSEVDTTPFRKKAAVVYEEFAGQFDSEMLEAIRAAASD